MIRWSGDSKYPLRLNSPVEVEFRDGTVSNLGTVADWHGTGGADSNWTHAGDEMDIVAYRELVT